MAGSPQSSKYLAGGSRIVPVVEWPVDSRFIVLSKLDQIRTSWHTECLLLGSGRFIRKNDLKARYRNLPDQAGKKSEKHVYIRSNRNYSFHIFG